MTPFSAASEALQESKTSSISSEGIKKEELNQIKNKKLSLGPKEGNDPNGPGNLSKNLSKPANQFGARSAPKFSKDKNYTKVRETVIYIDSIFKNKLDIQKKNNLKYTRLLIEKNLLILNFLNDVQIKLKNLNYQLKDIMIIKNNDNSLINLAVELVSEEYKIKTVNKVAEL